MQLASIAAQVGCGLAHWAAAPAGGCMWDSLYHLLTLQHVDLNPTGVPLIL